MREVPDRRLTKSEWHDLMALFSELCELPAAERKRRLDSAKLSEHVAAKLEHMLATLGQTMSLIDRPISERISLQPGWYEKHWVGRQIDEFRLDALLQEGAIAGVFLASQEEPVQRQVVIKLLRREAPADYHEFFRFEQRALAKLSHPNVAQIHTVTTTDDGLSYIVMEYIEGRVLSEFCNEESLGLNARLELFLQICDAVSYCHQRGVLHRDLKPSNILVRTFEGTPTPTIIDFGISSGLDARLESSEGRLLGTPEYMSPEHVLSTGDLDVQADVYSLGMVLFKLLVGRIPFDRTEIDRLDQAQRLALIAEFEVSAPGVLYRDLDDARQADLATERSTTPARLKRSLTAELDAIFLKATAKDRDGRYKSVGELATDLRRYLTHHTVGAYGGSVAYRMRKFVRRNAVVSAAVTAIVSFGLLFMVKLVDQNVKIRQEAQKAELEKQNAQRVASMIMETIGFADPRNVAREGEASINGMLEHGYRNLMRTKDLPDNVRANLLLSLSDAFRGTGRVDVATEINTVLLNDLNITDPSVRCRSLIAASRTAHRAGDLAVQLSRAQQAFDLCADSDIDTETALQGHLVLAGAFDTQDRYDEAEQILQKALALHESTFAAETPILADIHQSLATIRVRRQDIDGATAQFLRAKQIIGQAFADDHARAVGVELDLYRHLCYHQHEDCTEERGVRLQKNIARLWDSGSREEVEILMILANTAFYEARYEEAASQIEKSLAIMERLEDQSGLQYLPSLAFLSTIYLFMQQNEAALDASSRAYELVTHMQRSGASVSGRNLAIAQGRHAYALVANRQLEAAMPLITESIRFYSGVNAEKGNGLEIGLILRSVISARLGDLQGAMDDAENLAVVIGNNAPGDEKEQLIVEAIDGYIRLLSRWDSEGFSKFLSTWRAFKEHKGDQARLPPHGIIEEFIASRRAG